MRRIKEDEEKAVSMISILLDKLNLLTRLTPAKPSAIPPDDLIVDNDTTTRTMKMTQIEDRESFTGKKNDTLNYYICLITNEVVLLWCDIKS